MKKRFKFAIGERVFVLGHVGICIVTGRGEMEYVSGGKLNMYQIDGGHCAPQVMEQVIITPEEMQELSERKS